MRAEIADQVRSILATYNPKAPHVTATLLRDYWVQFEPKSIAVIKAEQREQQETLGVPVPVLRFIGAEVGQAAGKDVDAYLPLTTVLWDKYGREGRVDPGARQTVESVGSGG